jgi:hypothetical protein
VIDLDTFITTCIGKFPILGNFISDQIKFQNNKLQRDRINLALQRVKVLVEGKMPHNEFDKRKNEIAEFTIDVLRKISQQRHKKKIYIFSNILADSFIKSVDLNRLEHFVGLIERLSIESFVITAEMLAVKPYPRAMFHSHTSVMGILESKYGYDYLVTLLKELDGVGLIDFDLNPSSVVKMNPRFIVWWKEITNEFCAYIRNAADE